MNAVKIIRQDENTVTVGGYGVVFGGRDLMGETFTKETDFMLDLVPSKLVMYGHGLQTEVKHVLGRVPADRIKVQDGGLWIEAQLERSKEYVAEILRLVEMGIMGWSSGSVSHLVDVHNGVIKTWPIVEFSLTPTPAEPRTLGVEVLKQLAELHPELKALLPKAAGEAAAGATDGGGRTETPVVPHIEATSTDSNVLWLRAGAYLASIGEK